MRSLTVPRLACEERSTGIAKVPGACASKHARVDHMPTMDLYAWMGTKQMADIVVGRDSEP